MREKRPGQGTAYDAILDCLGNDRRRRLLALVQERTAPVTVADAATQITASEHDTTVDAVPAAAASSVRASLVHAHLPKLAGAGLVDWDRGAGTVVQADHPIFRSPSFRELTAAVEPVVGDVCAALAIARRRHILAFLRTDHPETTRTVLAHELRRRATDDAIDPNPRTSADLEAQLHHVDLPSLASAGLIDYEPEDGTIVRTGHPALPEGLVDLLVRDVPRTSAFPVSLQDGKLQDGKAEAYLSQRPQ